MTRLPLEMAGLVNITRFELRGNPWETIPEELIEAGTVGIVRFLRYSYETRIEIYLSGDEVYYTACSPPGISKNLVVNFIARKLLIRFL